MNNNTLQGNNQDLETQIGLPQIPTDPVEISKMIVQIENDLKQGLGAISEILTLIMKNKLTLDKIKSMMKDHLTKMVNE